MSKEILSQVEDYYSAKIREHGHTPYGVDWNSQASQYLRFEQLAKIWHRKGAASFLDYGCGYGEFALYLKKQKRPYTYTGFDVSPEMIAAAQKRLQKQKNVLLVRDKKYLKTYDYVVASGILNVKLKVTQKAWRKYLFDCLQTWHRLSKCGFAFNGLTKYSDRKFMRPHLYYGDPAEIFDYCKKHFSRNVALLHDYDLYEFTILIRKDL